MHSSFFKKFKVNFGFLWLLLNVAFSGRYVFVIYYVLSIRHISYHICCLNLRSNLDKVRMGFFYLFMFGIFVLQYFGSLCLGSGMDLTFEFNWTKGGNFSSLWLLDQKLEVKKNAVWLDSLKICTLFYLTPPQIAHHTVCLLY